MSEPEIGGRQPLMIRVRRRLLVVPLRALEVQPFATTRI